MFNEKNKLKNTNNLIPKMLDRLKHVDYWRHLWRPFWIFSNVRIMRRTPGSDLAPPHYQKWPGCPLFRKKNASRTLFKHIFRFPNQSIYCSRHINRVGICAAQIETPSVCRGIKVRFDLINSLKCFFGSEGRVALDINPRPGYDSLLFRLTRVDL